MSLYSEFKLSSNRRKPKSTAVDKSRAAARRRSEDLIEARQLGITVEELRGEKVSVK